MHDSRPGQFKCHQMDDSIILKYVSIEVPNGGGHSIILRGICLEDPRDGGALWAAVYGVVQGWT